MSTQGVIDAAFLGKFLVDIRQPCQYLGAEIHPEGPDLDPARVQQLVDSYHGEIRRFGVTTRLKVSVADSNAFDNFLRGLPDRAKSPPTLHPRSESFEDFPVTRDWPAARLGPLNLISGRHRCQALLDLLENRKRLGAPVIWEDYLWPADVFDHQLLQTDPTTFRLLQEHPDDFPKSDADVLNKILAILDTTSISDRKSLLEPTSKSKKWFRDTVGVESILWRVVLRRPKLCLAFSEFVQTQYGRSSFAILPAKEIVMSRLDDIWLKVIDEHLRPLRQVFAESRQKLSIADVTKLIKMQFPCSKEKLRMLFYPVEDDSQRGHLKGPLSINKNYVSNFDALPKMYEPVTIQGKDYYVRHPDFLLFLNNTQYFEVFQRFENLEIPSPLLSWSDITTIVETISKPTTLLLRAVMFWYLPDWSYPLPGSTKMDEFSWTTQVHGSLLQDQNPEAGYKKALTFVESIWDHVRYNSEAFKTTSRMLCELPFAGIMRPCNEVDYDGDVYIGWGDQIAETQFADNEWWKRWGQIHTADNKYALARQADIMGAVFMYPRLKKMIINTLVYGCNPPWRLAHKRPPYVESQDDFDEAVSELRQYARILRDAGWNPRVANMAEDLSTFTLEKVQRQTLAESRPPTLDTLVVDLGTVNANGFGRELRLLLAPFADPAPRTE
ncbi:hypothetical protein FQN50_009891 [Emmonsiellopsis sp. PD_5]|nr:hypothetical protein FQN50_009891 [Emmonsiellopsis sp. PD_5]